MRNFSFIVSVFLIGVFCMQCTSQDIPSITKEEFVSQADQECSKASNDLKQWIDATKKANGDASAAVTLIEKMSHRLVQLSRAIQKLPTNDEDAELLKQFWQEDRTMRDLLVKLSEVSKAFLIVYTKSQSSPEARTLLQKKSDEFGAELVRLQNDVSAQVRKRARAASRYGFESCSLVNPAQAWSKPNAD